jgi:hypothetical protein
MEPFHWRGDRRNFQHFNDAFVSLLGRAEPLPEADMDAFTDFIMTVELPPNPYRNVDESLPAAIPVVRGLRTPSVGDPARGESLFASRCANCHALPKGTSNQLIATTQRPQEFKVPHLRNAYEKVDLDVLRTFDLPLNTRSNQRRRGSFTLNDGVAELPILIEAMSPGGGSDADDLMAYVLAFSTESFACVGRQLSLRKGDPAEDVGPLIAETRLGHCDLVAKGVSGGAPAGWVYESARSGFLPDSAREPVVESAALLDGMGSSELVTFTAVPPGNGIRLGIDRDRDGCLDRDELRKRTDPANPGVRRADADDDGLSDDADLCPGWPQRDGLQTDTNANGIPNECECGDVSNDGRLDLRDLLYMALDLARRSPPGMALAKCNVSGAPGDDRAKCTWDDFFALRRGLEKSIMWRSVPRFPPLCRPTASTVLPASDVCVNPAPET